MAQESSTQPGPWRAQYNDAIRSLSGAFLFGIPFLYAIEMWGSPPTWSTGS